MISSYRDLDVWKVAMDVADRCYRLTRTFPKEELFGLTSQIRRAAVSVPANIAEGRGRPGTKDLLRFLGIASGSLAELETHLEIAYRVAMIDTATNKEMLAQTARVGQMLTALRKSLRMRLRSTT